MGGVVGEGVMGGGNGGSRVMGGVVGGEGNGRG